MPLYMTDSLAMALKEKKKKNFIDPTAGKNGVNNGDKHINIEGWRCGDVCAATDQQA